MILLFRRLAVCLVVAGLVSGCLHRRPASPVFEGCSTDPAPLGYIVRTAADAIISNQGGRVRAIASVPLAFDSIRARAQTVNDRSLCEGFWRTLEPEQREARLAMVHIGRTYWVRLRGGIQAFDESGRLLLTLVDLDL